MPAARYTFEERREQILNTFLIRVQHGKEPSMTMYEIARSLDMAPSTHVTKLIKSLCVDRFLTVEYKQHRPNMEKAVYSLLKGSVVKLKRNCREVVVNNHGKQCQSLLL